MFDGGWVESTSKTIELEFADDNITRTALHVVFGALYYDRIQLTDKSVLGVLAAATWLHLDDIRQHCSNFMKRGIRLETVVHYHIISEKYNLTDLQCACVNLLSQKLLILPDNPSSFKLLKQIP